MVITDQMVDKAVDYANAAAEPFVTADRRMIRAALESVFAAVDAEPIGYGLYSKDGELIYSFRMKDHADEEASVDAGEYVSPLYAAPVASQPAIVAVKPLEWDLDGSWNVSKTVIGRYVVRPCLATKFQGQWLLRRAQNEESDNDLYASEADAKEAAQKDYETRIRSALA